MQISTFVLPLTFTAPLLASSSCCIPLDLGGSRRSDGGPSAPLGRLAPPPPPPPSPSPLAPQLSPLPPSPAPSYPFSPTPVTALASRWRYEVPQVRDAFHLYATARPVTSDTLDGALMLCDVRISTSSHFDTFKGPDVSMMVRLGRAPVRTVRGPEDTWGATLSVPVAHLHRGDTVWLKLIDRDVWTDEVMGSRSLTFRGTTPLRFATRYTATECRFLPAAQVELRVTDRLRRADAALSRLERRVTPNLRRSDLGYPTYAHLAAEAALARVVAWIDPSDARARQRMERLHAFDDRFDHAVGEAVVRETAARPAPDAWVPAGLGFEARVAQIACGAARDRLRSRIGPAPAADEAPCLAVIVVRRVGAEPAPLPYRTDASYDAPMPLVVDAQGRRTTAPIVAIERSGGPTAHPAPLAKGERVTMVIALPGARATRNAHRLLLLTDGPRNWIVPLR